MAPEIDSAVLSDETLDPMFQGRLKVIQKKQGYRFSLDAVLLARLASVSPGDRVIDLGTGCAIIPLILACSTEAETIVGVEIQKELADIALRNVSLNEFNNRISIVNEDLRKLTSLYPPGSFDCILSNPPFRKIDTGRLNMADQKAIARHELRVSLPELLQVGFRLLKPGGRMFLIYPAFRLVDLFYEMRTCKLEPKALQSVHSHIHAPASMALIEGTCGGGIELQVKEPLILYDAGNEYTEALKKIYFLAR
jgi:tRNA1Val (adenine37-N6)-methyltransferase